MSKDRRAASGDMAPRILIIKRSALGDVVHALTVANALRDTYPDAHIAWLVESRFADLLDEHPALDEVITIERFPDRSPLRRLLEGLRVGRQLRARRFDWALDLQGLFKSAIFLRLSGARRRIGLQSERREANHWWCNELAPADNKPHAVYRCLQMARHLGCDVSSPRFDLRASPQAAGWARKTLTDAGMDETRPLVGINPGASMPHKQWPACRFAALANMLPDVQWVILGGPGDEPLAQGISAQIRERHLVTTGRTDIARLVALIGRLDALVTADTGPMHIAAALRVPTVALFGPTDPERSGPFGDLHRIISHPAQCSQTGRRLRCRRRPLCRNYECIMSITVEEVAEAVSDLLDRSPGEATEPPSSHALSDLAE